MLLLCAGVTLKAVALTLNYICCLVDIVVNNAGILRDKSFARISDDDWGKYVLLQLIRFSSL